MLQTPCVVIVAAIGGHDDRRDSAAARIQDHGIHQFGERIGLHRGVIVQHPDVIVAFVDADL
jgi:hypothetical protein